jgi:type I restriction enzyme S subunit
MSAMTQWKSAAIGRYVELINGYAFPSDGFTEGEGMPLIRIRDLNRSHTEVNFRGKYPERYVVKKGDLLIGMDGDFLTMRWKGNDALLNQRVCKLVTKNEDSLSQDFLFYRIIDEITAIHRITAATTVKHLSSKDVLEIEIDLPSVPEQTIIAEILSMVDRAIEQTEALIAKQQRLKTGLMQDLLTRGIDEHGNLRSEQTHRFKDSSLGRIPVEWEVVPLSHYVARLDAGVSVNADDTPCGAGQIGVLKTSALSKGRFLSEQNKSVIRDDISRVRTPLRANTVLVSRMNTPALVGESAYIDRDYPDLFLPDRIWMTVFQEGKESAARWMGFILTSPTARSYISLNATGTSGSMKNLPKKSLLAMPIASPNTLDEVDRITQILIKFEMSANESASRLSKLRSLKTALMQDLLTGRKRVTTLLDRKEKAK